MSARPERWRWRSTSTLTIGNQAFLQGGGTISGGAVIVGPGGTLAPNDFISGGTLTISKGLSLAGSSNFNLYGATTTSDQVTVGGALQYGGVLDANFVTPPTAAGDYPLFNAKGGESGTFSSVVVTNDAGYTATFNYATGQLHLVQQGVSGLWSANAGSATNLWVDPNNWLNGSVPQNQGDSATFGSGTNPTIDLSGGTETVSSLTFTNSAGVNYTIIDSVGTGSLVLQGLGTSPASVTVVSGSHSIEAGVALLSNVVVSGSGALTLGTSSSITDYGAHYSLTMDGAGGTLILSGSDTYSGGTIVQAGTLEVTAADALPAGQRLTVGAGGTFIFDPTAVAAPVTGSALAASSVAAVPEPGTLTLLFAALAVGFVAWRKRS